MNDYEVLKNRLTNGKPYLKEQAVRRITALANDLTITQEQANELLALTEVNGVDVLDADYNKRLTAAETAIDELTLIVADIVGGAV